MAAPQGKNVRLDHNALWHPPNHGAAAAGSLIGHLPERPLGTPPDASRSSHRRSTTA